jgi:DNA-binding HxlR family transcriptional regulator
LTAKIKKITINLIVILRLLTVMSFLEKLFRCDCAVNSALDIVGDKWTLVIIKLMLLEQKKRLKSSQKAKNQLHQVFYLTG